MMHGQKNIKQFAIVVTRRVSNWVSTVLGSYKCSSEKQVEKKNSAAGYIPI